MHARLTSAVLPLLAALALFALPHAYADDRPQGAATQQEAAKMDQEGQAAQAQRQAVQPFNNAPLWRDVRSGDKNPYQTTQVRGRETNVLIQNEGEMWRRVRNGPITVYGGWVFVLMLVALALFYWRRGRIMLREPKTGRMIERFSVWDRTVHWATAISFVILALSGLTMLFGRYVVLPLFGYTIFSALAILGKNLHNFVGPLFSVCIILMLVTFVKDNLPQRGDWLWIRTAGGLLTGKHVPSWRFNPGQKAWFWGGVVVLGLISAVSGFILDFANFGQTRETMQWANIIHATSGIIFATLSLGHIYVGTIGMEGAYDTMRHGYTDEAWAKEHHEWWYEAEIARRRAPRPGIAPATAPAASIQERW